MKITRRQLRQIIKEQVHLLREGPEKERLEALVAESPDDRAMGSAKIRGSLDAAKTIATERAAVALSEKLGGGKLSSWPIEGAVEDEVFYVVVEVS